MLFLVSVLLLVLHQCRTVTALGEGVCTAAEVNEVPTTHQVTYSEMEPFLDKCPGYFFRKCLMQRYKVKTRIDTTLVPQTQIVERCCPGYANVQGVCTPLCVDGCLFSNCTAPNICSCYDGYEHESSNKCMPKCSGCQHGRCMHPNVCFCNEGYDWDTKLGECVPRCYETCENGYCAAPDRCECHPNFTWNNQTQSCTPICEPTCINGQCIATNQCKCDYEYQFKNGSQNECEPICLMDCLNGKCIEPNVCECKEGFANPDKEKPHECHCGKFCVHIDDKCVCLEESQRIKGHKLYENRTRPLKCDDSNCINGFCADSDISGDGNTDWYCHCSDGYLKYDDYTCVEREQCAQPIGDNRCAVVNESAPSSNTFICDCINGVCTNSNPCLCVGGYQISDIAPNKCLPKCSRECVNGFCSEPDICECKNEHQYRNGFNDSDWNICYPICDPDLEEVGGCINGTCIAPDTCQCHEGFDLSVESNYTCIPSTKISDSITGGRMPRGLLIGSGVIIFAMIAAIMGFVIYRRHMHWRRSMNTDNYSSEQISFDCSEDF